MTKENSRRDQKRFIYIQYLHLHLQVSRCCVKAICILYSFDGRDFKVCSSETCRLEGLALSKRSQKSVGFMLVRGTGLSRTLLRVWDEERVRSRTKKILRTQFALLSTPSRGERLP